jgi:hypothetical protein
LQCQRQAKAKCEEKPTARNSPRKENPKAKQVQVPGNAQGKDQCKGRLKASPRARAKARPKGRSNSRPRASGNAQLKERPRGLKF